MATEKKRPAERVNAPSGTKAKVASAKRRKPKVSKSRCRCVHEFWAVVERDGTLVRGRNVLRAGRATGEAGPGKYEVVFTEDVSDGVYVATIGRPGIFTEPSGEIGVALRCCIPESNQGVWVDTHDSDGKYSDRAFHLIVLTD